MDVNRYYRGQLYPLLLLPMVAILVLSLAGTVKRRRKLSPKVFLSFIIVFASMTIALVIQMFIDVFLLIDITFVFAAMVMYGLIISSQIGQNLLQQQEIAHQRASIMVLQMRPHFIYNTLTSIYSLCNQEPQKARKVILDFTNYLRKNFNAISSESTIPFTEELEHIRAYLSVEQALYEDSLTVDYDIQHTMFRVPPLTLQPIVENAVKHGRDPYAGPLHIIIETRKTDSGSVVTVMNDGRGFTAYDDSEPHIALKNVQQRLKLMCGGSLDIRQGDEGGAVVTVYVADKM
ncbi:MAG: histidine kinase [Lachnospiraceae bacterium]|nr:histidine kinase [Lachnospiraceae bacterium]